MTFFSKSDTILVKRLELWASEYVRLNVQVKSLTRSLAQKGIVISSLPPKATRMDSFEVGQAKEKITNLCRQKENILKGLHNFGARVVDKTTMEILLPGGPHEGSFLSWQPGEPSISYWRMSADTRSTERQQLGGPRRSAQPVFH